MSEDSSDIDSRKLTGGIALFLSGIGLLLFGVVNEDTNVDLVNYAIDLIVQGAEMMNEALSFLAPGLSISR